MKTLKRYKNIILITIIILLISNCKKIELNCYTCTQSITFNNNDYVYIRYITTICGESEKDMITFEKMHTYDDYTLNFITHYKTTCKLNQ